MKNLILASDHAGFKLKEDLKSYLSSRYNIIDLGTKTEASVDYPDFGFAAAKAIEDKKAEMGIIMCGSGIGISIAANRNPAARAALVHNIEAAKLARQHNNANIACLGARFINMQEAYDIVDTFLSTEFEGGRHENRVKKLSS